MSDWTDIELRSAVEAYLSMLDRQQRGESFSKTDERRKLLAGPLNGRTHPGIEFRMRNISAVLLGSGRPILNGYLAAKNVGEHVAQRIRAMLQDAGALPATTPVAAISKSRFPKQRPPMIYFNIGWMRDYEGPKTDDPTIGGHGHLKDHTHGAEAYNFAPINGIYCGYRPPGSAENINIDRLGARPKDDHIDGVAVIWLARERSSGQTVIVGWYLNARVYRAARPNPHFPDDEDPYYSAEAKVADGRLLKVVAREFRIESSRTAPGAGFGQKPTWYGHPEVDERVWSYIRSLNDAAVRKPATAKQPPRNNDPELRRKVEKAAVDHAVAYYEALYGPGTVKSVESLARGWDLEVRYGDNQHLVEVKGLLRGDLICELTPNEYEKMRSRAHRRRYVVYVVTNALAVAPDAPIPAIFEYVRPGAWQTKDGRTLKIKERVGAVLSC